VALVQASYAAALALLPVGVTLLIQYTAVLLVAVVAFAVFRERVRARLWAAIGLVLLGLAAVARPWEARLDPTGVALAAVAALTLAFYFLVGERMVGRTSPLAVAFWTMVFASAFWALFSGWWQLSPAIFTKPLDVGGQWGSWWLPLGIPLLVTVVVGSFLAFLLFFSALKHLTATAAGITASAEVVFAFAVAWLWLGETLDPVGIVGAAVVLAGIALAQTARQSKTVVDAELVLPAEPGVGGRT
jgi:drug/metabolite transporter (DMT)-like permease